MTPTVQIRVRGKRRGVKLDAVVDTGFDGEVCLPIDVAEKLGLEFVGKLFVELADGTRQRELLFAGDVSLLGKTRSASIFLTDSAEALIGTALLSDCRLMIDFTNGNVRVARKK
jgi:clan AA aspartic protease